MKPSLPGGLRPTPRSSRDFSLARTFGSTDDPLPASFLLPEVRKPQNQGRNLCTAEMVAEAGSDEYGIEMSSDWQAGKISLTFGKPVTLDGADMRKAVSTGQIFGFLPKKASPFTHRKQGEDFICDWANWPRKLDEVAAPYKRPSYFVVDGPADPFENMQRAIFAHRNTGMIGMPWYQSFNEAHLHDGRVPEREGKITWHAVTVKGWIELGGKTYLVIRSWSGRNGGKNSYYYFSRDIYNACMRTWGAIGFMYRDVAPDLITSLREQQLSLYQIVLDLTQKLYLKLKYGLAS